MFVSGLWNIAFNSETYNDFGEKSQLALDYLSNNLGGLGARTGTGILVGQVINGSAKKAPGAALIGPALSAAAFRADSNYLIRNGVDPAYAFILSELGLAGEEQITALAKDLFDDKKLQEFTGIPCEEGK
jgi:hypothetical protein